MSPQRLNIWDENYSVAIGLFMCDYLLSLFVDGRKILLINVKVYKDVWAGYMLEFLLLNHS